MKFLRQDSTRYSKLGKRRKSKQVWRKPKGRDSKMRLSRRSYPVSPSVGYKSPKKGESVKLLPVRVHDSKSMESVPAEAVVLLAKVGAKKKLELIRKAQERKIKIVNVGGKHEA